ncbi:unnamed protein product [Clonostachys rosea]|uniref:peptide-methionine (S)-S-oxide reductase n=1 Tax=Bionectria ochroleuca TaxID=29856 RepID=A0ABY6TUH2_BIOOC|nr:unnamed protein product [Clonostachys rosea]
MASHLPPLLARLIRPFTYSARLSLAADGGAGGAATQRCTIASGCFWGTEHLYRKHFTGKGLVDAKVGYTGGDLNDPSYKVVCGGKTGHAEAVEITFDPSQVTYRQLLEFFYKTHDPTTLNSQGPDRGPQYRSAIFYHDAQQEAEARDVTARANEQWWKGGIVTEITPAGEWWSAEEYHQRYLERTPGGYECPTHFIQPFPPLK